MGRRSNPNGEDEVDADILHVSDATFDKEVLECPLPVLVDFWADWCAACKMIAPLVGEISREYQEKIKVAGVNVEEGVRTTSRYGVRGIPVLLLFKDGEVKETLVGLVPKDLIIEALSKWL
jgi:thioredoxin 1